MDGALRLQAIVEGKYFSGKRISPFAKTLHANLSKFLHHSKHSPEFVKMKKSGRPSDRHTARTKIKRNPSPRRTDELFTKPPISMN
jgi:hypothetical protein